MQQTISILLSCVLLSLVVLLFQNCGRLSLNAVSIAQANDGSTLSVGPTLNPSPSSDLIPISWGGTHIPWQLPGGMSALQADAVLSLVSIAENSTTSWWTKYSYIEDIEDGRGYTINIVGFCTGTGDFLWLVENLRKFAPYHPLIAFLPALRSVNGTSSHAGLDGLPALVSGLANDPDYIRATWDAIIHFYWGPSMRVADSLGLNLPISRGQLYDVALNMGDLRLVNRVKALPPSKGGDEIVWLAEFQTLWLNQITKVDRTLNKGQPDRALMWKSILDKGNLKLVRPLAGLVCYGDAYTVQ